MRTEILVTSGENINIDELRNYLRHEEENVVEEIDLEENLLLSMLSAARNLIERKTGMSLVQKTINVFFTEDDLDEGFVTLPYSPHIARDGNLSPVISVSSFDYKGTETILTKNTDYCITGGEQLQLQILTTYITTSNYKTIYKAQVTCGKDVIPEGLKLAILEQCKDFNERGDESSAMSSRVQAICNQFLQKSTLS